MTVWDELRDKANQVAGNVSKKVSEFADTAGIEYELLKIKRAINLLESEINEIEQALGKRVYELHRHDKIEDKELKTRCYEIDGLREKIHKNEDEMDKIRQEAEEKAKAKDAFDDEKVDASDEKATHDTERNSERGTGNSNSSTKENDF